MYWMNEVSEAREFQIVGAAAQKEQNKKCALSQIANYATDI